LRLCPPGVGMHFTRVASTLLPDGSLVITDVDSIFTSCGALRSLYIVDRLEQKLGKPVICSNQAMIWDALRLAGINDRIDDYGRLMRDQANPTSTSGAASTTDLFVIGGGINGCGIARDAAERGLTVTLAEMNGLASATSSASTKLFHGGLRYLEYFEIRLVREALREREILLRAMPLYQLADAVCFALSQRYAL